MNRRSLLIGSAALGAVALPPAVSMATPDLIIKDHGAAFTHAGTGQIVDERSDYTVPAEPLNTLHMRLGDWRADQVLDGKHDEIVLSREAFKALYGWGYIDFHSIGGPLHYGHPVRVPGSALA
jgi:hypothetical protein